MIFFIKKKSLSRNFPHFTKFQIIHILWRREEKTATEISDALNRENSSSWRRRRRQSEQQTRWTEWVQTVFLNVNSCWVLCHQLMKFFMVADLPVWLTSQNKTHSQVKRPQSLLCYHVSYFKSNNVLTATA